MLRTLLFMLLAFVPSLKSHSQAKNTIENPDTTRRIFPVTHGSKKWKPNISLDANRSYYKGIPVKINGVRAGVEYLGTHRFGLGYYWLNRKGLLIDLPIDLPASGTDTSLVQINLSYGTLFYERVFFKNKRWEIDLPMHAGLGVIKNKPEDGSLINTDFLTRPSFVSLSPGFTVKWYVLYWLAPHVGFQYRWLLNSEASLRDAFSGPYYSFGVKVLVGEIYKHVIKDKK